MNFTDMQIIILLRIDLCRSKEDSIIWILNFELCMWCKTVAWPSCWLNLANLFIYLVVLMPSFHSQSAPKINMAKIMGKFKPFSEIPIHWISLPETGRPQRKAMLKVSWSFHTTNERIHCKKKQLTEISLAKLLCSGSRFRLEIRTGTEQLDPITRN